MDQMQKITVIENEVEANLLASILQERNIPHIIKSYHDVAYNGIFQLQKGWGQINAPLAYKQIILEILEDIRTQGPENL